MRVVVIVSERMLPFSLGPTLPDGPPPCIDGPGEDASPLLLVQPMGNSNPVGPAVRPRADGRMHGGGRKEGRDERRVGGVQCGVGGYGQARAEESILHGDAGG